jgi:ribose transport system substrate-binding protein
MKRRHLALALGASALAALGCGRGAPDAAAKPRIALVLKTLNSPFFVDMQKGAQEAASRLNVDLVVQAAEREIDVDKQMQIIENLVQTRVAALCVTPSGSKEIVPAIQKANAAGIPVVIVDTRVDPAAAKEAGIKVASFVGSDNYEGGRLAGKHLVEATGGKAKVAVLEGIPGHETGDSRLRGFKDAIKDSPGVSIVASQPANWERDLGFNVFQNMLQAHPELDAVFACNDMMALGAVEAIAAAGKTGKIRVFGFDAVDDARQAIQSGTMVGSVAQFPSEMGRLAVESAAKLLKGETPPADQTVRIELVVKTAEAAPTASPSPGGKQ